MVLGLTGGIASGKSSVANALVECGAILVSADQIAREVVTSGSPTLARLVDVFGEEILTLLLTLLMTQKYLKTKLDSSLATQAGTNSN